MIQLKEIARPDNQPTIQWFTLVILLLLAIKNIILVATLIRKAIQTKGFNDKQFKNEDELWKLLMLEPEDYSQRAIKNPMTKVLMEKIVFEHGGEEYDKLYPEGIPTSVEIWLKDGKTLTSGLIKFPPGHSR